MVILVELLPLLSLLISKTKLLNSTLMSTLILTSPIFVRLLKKNLVLKSVILLLTNGLENKISSLINGHLWHLHLAIDDASGEVVGAYFDTQETLNGYYNVFYQILSNYGIPSMFYTDRHTVFEYKRKNNAFDDDDTFTQFSYACHNLGVVIKTTSITQAKGRIERLNQIFQSRLPVELRRAHITNIEEANEFLKSYLKKFNDKFALHLNTTKSVFETQPSMDLSFVFCKAEVSNLVISVSNCLEY